MKKVTILFVLAIFASSVFAQYSAEFKIAQEKKDVVSVKKEFKGGALWEENFDGAVTWSFGADEGTKSWAVGEPTDFPSEFGQYMGWITEAPTNTTGKFAGVTGIPDLLAANVDPYNCWIRFDGINTTGCAVPKLSWTQNFRKFNYDECYVDYSLDGGASWTPVAVTMNNGTTTNQYAPDYPELLIPGMGNQSNVSIRFRWYNPSDDNNYGAGYGWQIDDIMITATPAYDMALNWAVVNFFEGVDYTDPQYADYFHLSSHYGQIPQAQYSTPNAVSWFNIRVQNKGTEIVTPVVNVKVFNPNETEIYNQNVTGNAMPIDAIDTLDLLEDLYLGANPTIGMYRVEYTLSIQGQSDANTEDNTYESFFMVTPDQFGRDVDNITAQVTPGNYSIGGNDGEMMGTTYLYMFEEYIRTISVFIGPATTPGTSFIAHVMQYDEGSSSWVDLATSEFIEIQESDLGTWKHVNPSDEVYVTLDGNDAKKILVGIEIYYNGVDNDFYIGYDKTDKHSIWGTKWYFLSGSFANQWVSLTNWGLGGLGVRVSSIDLVNAENNVINNNINIYPNPSNGVLNIENVAGAKVQIVNMMGQVVENIENAQIFNTVDMSKYANGTYFVKVINGAQVNTYKVNLMK